MSSPAGPVSKRLLELQKSLEDAASAPNARDPQVLQALALIAEGVAKTARDVSRLQKQITALAAAASEPDGPVP